MVYTIHSSTPTVGLNEHNGSNTYTVVYNQYFKNSITICKIFDANLI